MIFRVWVAISRWFRDLTARCSFVVQRRHLRANAHSWLTYLSPRTPPRCGMTRRRSSRDPALELPDDQGSVQAGTKLSFERAGRWESSCEIKVRLCAEGDRRPMSPRLCGFSVRSLHPNTPPPLSLARRLVHILPERR